MPTPPFSQDRRDWLSEVSGLFASKKKPVAKNQLKSANTLILTPSSSSSSFRSTSTYSLIGKLRN